jgi:hypothetical protein
MIRAIVGTTATVAGDYNEDGRVDAADYVVWRKTLGEAVPVFSGADGNGNGMVDQADYNFWRTRFGQPLVRGTASADGGPVPEPSAVVLLVAASAALGANWRVPRPFTQE